jgi:glucosamine 6-phosphate synthetase-like amidotransferase/phosphosugar isomerase protein
MSSVEVVDTFEVLKAAQREKKVYKVTLAICNILKGLLVQIADFVLPTRVGKISVAATKSVLSQSRV